MVIIIQKPRTVNVEGALPILTAILNFHCFRKENTHEILTFSLQNHTANGV